ncbi:hypothetical protein CAPTEDRAFT_151400 [Capitella teleta]|uniref:Uncharacterized protein n=1 Tax=Capitella teleta TaxID=283909 RepID=R7UAR1_CAPTE|nr:hypothetical protein CAPTEDRAFT_151400 [Capitella teleta]|eukprot:ELU00231.1 hypothetical protein CAPTEDRAFT_151400 [Capitella teleta]
MADDQEVLRETWDGKIAVCFVLASEEVFSVEQPEPFYMMVSRQTYFPLVTDRVLRIFTKHIDPDLTDSQSWLEDNGLPLKWHYPVGVLFDLLGVKDRLPWTITVHFQNFPDGDLLECHSKDAVEAHFMSTVKEADSLKHRSQIINTMQRKDHKQLWSALLNGRQI